MKLKFQVTAFFDVIGTEMGEELHVMSGMDLCLNLRSTTIGDIEGTFLDVLLPKTKLIFLGIIYRPPNNINFLECFNKNLDDINLNNEVFLLGDFIINLFHNGKYILKENQAMQNRIPGTHLVSQYNLFCQRYSLELIFFLIRIHSMQD